MATTALGWAQAGAAVCVALAAAGWDGRTRRIPNALSLGGMAAGWALSYARGGWADGPVNLQTSLVATGIGFGAFVFFYLLGGMGAGDVKLMAALGALSANAGFLVWTLAYTALAGAPLALFMLWRRGDFWGGVARGLGQSVRWKYAAPPPDGRPVRSAPAGQGLAENPNAAALPAPGGATERAPDAGPKTPSEPAAPRPLYLPYAIAVAAGLLLATATYLARGAPLPFFR